MLKACEALGALPARTLTVGDSGNDAAARAAGRPVMLISYGYNHGELIQTADTNALVDRIEQINIS